MTAVRWGILGAANFALGHMGPAIHAAKGAELYALATSSPDKAAGFAAFNPALKVQSSNQGEYGSTDEEVTHCMERLRAFYRPHNERLFRLIGRSFDW